MITLTPEAQQYLAKHLTTGPDGTLGIRLGLRDYGCSGYRYELDFVDVHNPEDHVFDFDAVRIFVEPQFMRAFHGMEIDYVTAGVNSELQFNNPNVVNACGCGESVKFAEDEK